LSDVDKCKRVSPHSDQSEPTTWSLLAWYPALSGQSASRPVCQRPLFIMCTL
jgi:hypothetical protein